MDDAAAGFDFAQKERSASVTGEMSAVEIDLNFLGTESLKFEGCLPTVCLRHGGGAGFVIGLNNNNLSNFPTMARFF